MSEHDLCTSRAQNQPASHPTKITAYLAAGALEHLGDGDDADGLGDGRPDEDLGQGAGLHRHVVRRQGGHLVHVACFGRAMGGGSVCVGGRREGRGWVRLNAVACVCAGRSPCV